MTVGPHVCPDSGGAHHFHPDVNGVPICSCGEIDLTLEERLLLVEIQADPPMPPDEVRRLYNHVVELLRDVQWAKRVRDAEGPK